MGRPRPPVAGGVDSGDKRKSAWGQAAMGVMADGGHTTPIAA